MPVGVSHDPSITVALSLKPITNPDIGNTGRRSGLLGKAVHGWSTGGI